MILIDDLAGLGFLAYMAGAQVVKRTAGFFSHLKRGVLDPLSQVHGEVPELLEQNLFDLQVSVHGTRAIELG